MMSKIYSQNGFEINWDNYIYVNMNTYAMHGQSPDYTFLILNDIVIQT